MALGPPPIFDRTTAQERLDQINADIRDLELLWVRNADRRVGVADKPTGGRYSTDMRDRDLANLDDQSKAIAAAHAAVVKRRDQGGFEPAPPK